MLPEVLISFVVANTLGMKQHPHQPSLAPNPSGQRNNFPRRDGQYCSIDPLLCAQLLPWLTVKMTEWSFCIVLQEKKELFPGVSLFSCLQNLFLVTLLSFQSMSEVDLCRNLVKPCSNCVTCRHEQDIHPNQIKEEKTTFMTYNTSSFK